MVEDEYGMKPFTNIRLRIDAVDGPVIGQVVVGNTGSVDTYKAFNTKVKGASGVHDLYLCFGNVSGDIHLDWWQFK